MVPLLNRMLGPSLTKPDNIQSGFSELTGQKTLNLRTFTCLETKKPYLLVTGLCHTTPGECFLA